MRLVDKVWPGWVDQVVPSNHAIVKSEHELLLSIKFKANIHLSPNEENHLVNFIKFAEDYRFCELLPGLKVHKNVVHENWVRVVVPSVERWLTTVVVVLETKMLAECKQKLFEQKFCKYFWLNTFWQFFKNWQFIFVLKGYDSVVFPSIFKILRNFLLKILRKWLFSVKFFQNIEKSGKLIFIAEVFP